MLLLLLVFHFRWAILLPSRCRIVGMGMNAVNNEEKKTRNCQSRNDKEKKKSYIDTKWSEAKSISMRRLRWSFGDFGLQIGFVSHPGRDGWKLLEFIQSSTLLFASRFRSISWDFCCCRREKKRIQTSFRCHVALMREGRAAKGTVDSCRTFVALPIDCDSADWCPRRCSREKKNVKMFTQISNSVSVS